MANTPAPGITITVNSGGNLQAALNNARCGDTIHLQAGATFTGVFTFPNKNCDDSHWIIVRTSSDDSLLPAEGSRLTPCYAGVSSLPGRPAFNCSWTKNVLAKLVTNRGRSSGPVVFAPDASHYRLIGLELTRVAGIGLVYALASPIPGTVTSKIIYDRIWFHGTAHDETTRGIQLGGSTYVCRHRFLLYRLPLHLFRRGPAPMLKPSMAGSTPIPWAPTRLSIISWRLPAKTSSLVEAQRLRRLPISRSRTITCSSPLRG